MRSVCRALALAFTGIFGFSGCVPVPYPADSSTEALPSPLAAPVTADQSVTVNAYSDTEECILRELTALQPPLRIVERTVLPEEFRGVYFSADERLRTLADPEVQRAIADHQIVYAVDLGSTTERGCDFNLLFAAGGYVRRELRARIYQIPSGRDMGEVVVKSSGELMGLGIFGCGPGNFEGSGLIFFPLHYACEDMAEELHRYFTSGR